MSKIQNIPRTWSSHDFRGSNDGSKCQKVLLFSSCSLDTILKLLQSSETQRIRYEKETITTFSVSLTSSYFKSS